MAQTQQIPVYQMPPQAQPAVQVAPLQSTSMTSSGYSKDSTRKGVRIVSMLQIVFGTVCFALQIVTLAVAVDSNSYRYRDLSWIDQYTGTGFWVGGYYIITGVIGLLSAKRKSNCLVIAMMVLNIILASCFSLTMIGMMAGSIGILSHYRCYYYFDYVDYDRPTCNQTAARASLALDCIMLILSMINFGFGIGLSVVGCCNTCCKSSPRSTTGMPGQPMVVYQVAAQPQTIYSQQGFTHNMMAQPSVAHNQPGVVYAQPGYQGPPLTQSQPVFQCAGMAQPAPTNQSVIRYPRAEASLAQAATPQTQSGASQIVPSTVNYNQPGQAGSLPPAYQEKIEEPAGVHAPQ